MAEIKFVGLDENIVTQVAKDVTMGAGKALATAALATVTGSPAGGMAAFNHLKNMFFDKKTYKTEQEKEKKIVEIIKSFKDVLSSIEHNNTKLTETEISVMIDFINDYMTQFEQNYRKNLAAKYTQQDIVSDIVVQARKRLTYGDVKNLRDWVRVGTKYKTTTLFKMLGEVIEGMMPIYKNLEIIKRKKAGQYYSPDAK